MNTWWYDMVRTIYRILWGRNCKQSNKTERLNPYYYWLKRGIKN